MVDLAVFVDRIGAKGQPVDAVIAKLAALQHGVVARWQLLILGISSRKIARRLESGVLHRVHRGVYAVGHPKISPRGHAMAAVLACGPTAALSHRSAAALWNLLRDQRTFYDVTSTRRSGTKHRRIRLHQPRGLHPEDRTEVNGIPVTSVARTLFDVAEAESERLARRAFNEAIRLQLLNLHVLERVAERSRGRRGCKRFRALIEDLTDTVPETRSDPEERFLELCRERGLPEPAMNVTVAGHVVDAYWPERNLVVEIDSWGFHRTRDDFENDHQRDIDLKLARVETLRVTDRRLEEGVAAVGELLGY
jgi:predicted transcriptional regulator of viral defense system/very-short-patch-repair endonuclease